MPLLVGGSGLYVRAVLDDLEFPGTDAAVRARLEAELADVGAAALHERLAALDPAAAAAVLPSNGRRIVRALEVIELTGGPFRAQLPEPRPHYPAVVVGLDREPAELDARIALRVDRMWAAGFVDEVAALAADGLREGPTASRALGYAQVLAQFDGTLSAEEARERTVSTTRRFVRRQRSWFRRDPPSPGSTRPAPTWSTPSPRVITDRTIERVTRRPARGCSSGTAPRTTSSCCPTPTASVWPEARLDPAMVRRLCDRRAGLGGDGVLRVVRSAHVPDAPAVLGDALDRCEWFMDHRNADGSHAEMCGNGIRLFLHVLVTEGLLDRAACEAGVLVGTRGGPRRVGATPDGDYWVDMGPARPFGEGTASWRVGPSPASPSRWATRTWPR